MAKLQRKVSKRNSLEEIMCVINTHKKTINGNFINKCCGKFKTKWSLVINQDDHFCFLEQDIDKGGKFEIFTLELNDF